MPWPRSSNQNDDGGISQMPADTHSLSAVRKRSIDGVSQEIDEHLLELIGVSIEKNLRAMVKLHDHALLEMHDAFDELCELNEFKLRRRQLGKEPVGLHKAVQRVSAAFDDAESTVQIVQHGFITA